jgi:hypothetical protein
MRDAKRLALRETFFVASTYKDSVKIDKALTGKFLKALLAIHNATALTVRDTVLAIYKLRTNYEPEMNNIIIKANAGLYWMQKLMNLQTPTGHTILDSRMTGYRLNVVNYYQSALYDVAVFKTDSNFNMAAMAVDLASLQDVKGSEPILTVDDARNISATVGNGYIDLVYTYGWSTCENGCDFKINWKLRVYDNCIVEYSGYTGDPINTGLRHVTSATPAMVYPNPFTDKLSIFCDDLHDAEYALFDLTGQLIRRDKISSRETAINIDGEAQGVYLLRCTSAGRVQNFRIIRL